MSSIRVWASCLASYNSGRLFGEWIDVTGDVDELGEAIQAMLKASPSPNAEEWAFHDLEGPGVSLLGEFSSLAEVCRLADIVNERDEDLVAVAVTISDDLDALDRACERYNGVHKSAGEFAYQQADDCGDLDTIPETYRDHIDWDSIARNYDCDGWHFVETGYQECHVFSPDY